MKVFFLSPWRVLCFWFKFFAEMAEVQTWSEPPEALSLPMGEVHVWRLALDQPDSVLNEFRATLEPHELERAGRFHFEKHRRHFVVGRGGLRYVLPVNLIPSAQKPAPKDVPLPTAVPGENPAPNQAVTLPPRGCKPDTHTH